VPGPGLSRVEGAAPGGLASALEAAGLPPVSVSRATRVYQFASTAGPIGWAALEHCGEAALLRSVVVAEAQRGGGVGAAMVRAVIGQARDDGMKELWLLTETGRGFFARQGFALAPRASAPAAIRDTSEFASICPQSADCMTMRLGAR
jgi:amino-acid N-acetyltransferase